MDLIDMPSPVTPSAIGAKMILTRNIVPVKGLVEGTFGIIDKNYEENEKVIGVVFQIITFFSL